MKSDCRSLTFQYQELLLELFKCPLKVLGIATEKCNAIVQSDFHSVFLLILQ
uniref:Uncharacterized protein n=1 Tax=Anguilla anguilla TaxID=7936 RepID=A0A0E9PNL1_ANGAN